MPAGVAAGGLDWGGAGVTGEVITVREAGDVAGVAQQLGGQHRADPKDLGQGGAMLTDRGADGLAGRLDLPVQATHIGQQLPSDPLTLDINGSDRVDPAQQSGGPSRSELPLGAARVQVGPQHMQPAQGPGAFGDQVVTAVGQQPSPGGQLGRHVNDLLPGADQQLAMPRPRPLAPSTAQHRCDQVAAQASSWVAAWLVAASSGWPSRRLWGRGRPRSASACGVDADGDHGRPFVAADTGFRDGQPDFRWAHASVEPRHGGGRPQPGTLSASQPDRVARSLRGRKLGERTVKTTTTDHLDLLVWAARFGAERRWAVEDCRHLSRRLERDLLGAGQQVVRVPPKLMAHAVPPAAPTASRTRSTRWRRRCGNRSCRWPAWTVPPGSSGCWSTTATTWSPSGPASSPGCAGTSLSSTLMAPAHAVAVAR